MDTSLRKWALSLEPADARTTRVQITLAAVLLLAALVSLALRPVALSSLAAVAAFGSVAGLLCSLRMKPLSALILVALAVLSGPILRRFGDSEDRSVENWHAIGLAGAVTVIAYLVGVYALAHRGRKRNQ